MSGVFLPKVSWIMQVSNLDEYAIKCINSILDQTERSFELILVVPDNQILDNEFAEYQKMDDRIKFEKQSEKSLLSCLSDIVKKAVGKYIVVAEVGCEYKSNMLKNLVSFSEQNKTDFTVFDYIEAAQGEEKNIKSVRMDYIEKNKNCFSYEQCQNGILDVLDSKLFNKIYRSDFLMTVLNSIDREYRLSESVIIASTAAVAEQIGYVNESYLTYHGSFLLDDSYDLTSLQNEITCVNNYVIGLPHGTVLKDAVIRYSVVRSIHYLDSKSVFDDISGDYDRIHEEFQKAAYKTISPDMMQNDFTYLKFFIIRKQSFEELKQLLSRKVIVSFTSYPERIRYVSKMLPYLFDQTKQADEIILWLANSQFPGREEDLPEDLLEYCDKGLQIKWCDDLKPHKKYFYAMQMYPDAVIITIDDDIKYPSDMIERLYLGYLCYPDVVSAGRVNLATFDENGCILPYSQWITECCSLRFEPSMQLVATGCAGVLYPPALLGPKLFDQEAIRQTCLTADDLWLKAMECVYHIPVVLVYPLRFLSYIEDTQETALWKTNIDAAGNDVQLKNIENYFSAEYGNKWIENSMLDDSCGITVKTVFDYCELFIKERKVIRAERNDVNNKLGISEIKRISLSDKLQQTYREKSELNDKLQQTYREKSELNDKLQQTYREKSELNDKLQQTYREKSELNDKLQQTYHEKSELNNKLQQTYREKSERGKRIKELETELENMKNSSLLKRLFNS